MDAMEQLRRLFQHAAWADRRLLDALRAVRAEAHHGARDALREPSREATRIAIGEATRELAHALGADETWLSRLEGRPSRSAIWPDVTLDELQALIDETHAGYARYLEALTEEHLATPLAYTNSAGLSFRDPIGEILLHVAMHGQYHRGKTNVILRTAGLEPAPADYISFVRGTPAATVSDPRTSV